LLAEHKLCHRHQRSLCALAENGTAGSEEEVLHQLLRKRGASAYTAALQIFFGVDLHCVPIKPMVLVEASVLRSDDSMLEVGRDLAEGNECVAFMVRRTMYPGLQTALDVYRRGWRVNPAGGNQA